MSKAVKKERPMEQYRQGDVFIERAKGPLPDGGEPVESGVLAYGEVTGHAHRLCGKYRLLRFVNEGGALAFEVLPGGAKLLHEEHAPIEFGPGVYKVRHQREYSPEEIRRVAD